MTVVGYAPGAWDLFHVGHLNVLRHAKAHCDYLVAGVVDDDMLELAKGRRPVVPVIERAEIVRHIEYVDEVFVETQPDKLETWRRRPFDVFFKGDDWKGTDKGRELERRFGDVGVDVIYFPYTVHTSSTVLRRALDLLDERRSHARPGRK
jgi:glycerol-3-phosphate cytidylyltransferase